MEHPKPCIAVEMQEELSREMLEALEKTIAKLQQKQEAASTEAGACHVRRENREKELAERKEKCRNKIEAFGKEANPAADNEIEPWLVAQKKKLAKEEETLSQEIKKKKELSHKLEEAEAKKIALQKEETEATEKKLLAKEQFDRCQAAYTERNRTLDYTLTGRTVRMVSRFRCPVDIIGMTTSEKAWRKLNLSWGVKPVLCEEYNSMEVMFYNAMNEAKSVMKLKKGDHIVLTGGLINGKTGNTNVIKVETV